MRNKKHAITPERLRDLIDMAQMILDGKSYRDVGNKYGISKQAVQQRLVNGLDSLVQSK